jgi:Tol biopolymer transport system component
MSWPLFPVVGTPLWHLEGLAVAAETQLTGMGRLHGSFHEMVVRTAVLEDRFDPLDRVSGHTQIWPGGQRPYVYGSLFLDFLARRHAVEANRRILDATAAAWFPPPLFFNHVGRIALGESFTSAYDAWYAELAAHYAVLADSLRAAGLTEAESVAAHGRHALQPRGAPDGTRLVYAAGDGRESLMARVIDAESGATIWQRRRNSFSSAGWLPDGSGFVTAQLEFVDRYRIFSDLWLFTPAGERRLTHRARLHDPDMAPDGRRIVAAQGDGATTRIVLIDFTTGAISPLHDFSADVHWATPRWSPDGSMIAAARWRRGGELHVVVLDQHGTTLHEITDDHAVDGAPAWSPDGRYIIFSSDRTGIPNLYAAELRAGQLPLLHQITNVLTGAFQPDVAPDGSRIFFVQYHSDGFHIVRMPFDTAAWRAAPPFALDRIAALRAPGFAPDTLRARADTLPHADTISGPARRYRALRHARPRFWLPIIVSDTVTGTYLGAFTFGNDLVRRHDYLVGAAVDPGTGRWRGAASYSFAGLGNPVLDFAASRDWSNQGVVQVQVGEETTRRILVEREDAISGVARLLHPRFRTGVSLAAGAEFVRRTWSLHGSPPLRLADHVRRQELAGVIARASFARFRMPAFAISPQDGYALSLGGRRRWDVAHGEAPDRGYSELTGFSAAYRSIDAPGFARHVLALRATMLWRSGERAPLSSIGGPTNRLLAVRGYREGVRIGTEAWTASAEYRMPVALVGRGIRLWPVFLDRVAFSAFIDAGDIRCNPDAAAARPLACTPPDGVQAGLLAGAGGELVADIGFFFAPPIRLRAGIGQPLRGPPSSPVAYLQLGPSF